MKTCNVITNTGVTCRPLYTVNVYLIKRSSLKCFICK